MKRITALLLIFIMAFGLAGCGAESSSDQSENPAPSKSEAQGVSPLIPDGPAPEINLITGRKPTEGRAPGERSAAVMIDNARAALPQRGIASADAVFEMVTEGGITRLLAVFSDRTAIPQLGPVRSARDQHLQCAMPFNPIIVHIGTSIYAENLLNLYHYGTIDGRYLGSTAFWFDDARSNSGYLNEHCWYTDSALIAAGIGKHSLAVDGASQPLFDFVPYDESPVVPAEGNASEISISYSDDGIVTMNYDASGGKYLKTAYGAPHIDESTGEQLSFDNVIVLFTEVKRKDPSNPDNIVMDFAMQGGHGYYCYGGKYQKIAWEKGKPEDPIRFTDGEGNPLSVNVGKSYIGIVGLEREGLFLLDGINLNGVIGGEPAVTGENGSAEVQPNPEQSEIYDPQDQEQDEK